MITLKEISVSFGEKTVLAGFSATFSTGVTLITGASGCGKTTLLRVIAGLQKAEGEICGVASGKVAMAFQEPRLLPRLSILEQLTIVGATKERSIELLAAVDLEKEINAYPEQLSGGMRSRVNVLRALAAARPIVLMDEPLSGLDDENSMALVSLIAKEMDNKIIIIVTHHPEAFEKLKPNQIKL